MIKSMNNLETIFRISYRIPIFSFLMLVMLHSTILMAEPLVFTPEIDVQLTSWQGENVTDAETYDADAGMLAIQLKLHKDRWYTGLAFKGGEFEFTGTAPRREDGATSGSATETVTRGEFDLVAGYYFWDRVSLFVDIKASSNTWISDDHQVSYGGLGFGITAYRPYSDSWLFYGSFGVVPLTAKVDDAEVGSGEGSSLEFGALRRLGNNMNLLISIKSQSQNIDYDGGDKQQSQIGGLNIGFSRSFDL